MARHDFRGSVQGGRSDQTDETGADRVTDRTIILHYHLFKNAGTSFDGILKRNFPGQWAQAEFPGSRNAARVAEWIAGSPDIVAFSTHTGRGPLPDIPGTRVISALFLRDPIERIRSVYRFERRQSIEAEAPSLGAMIARTLDFDGYVQARLAMPGDRQCRNFQVERLSSFIRKPYPELKRARQALARLSFVGEVESFADSMDRFARLVRPIWPGFDPTAEHLNRSDDDEPLSESPELVSLLEDANALDRLLLRYARKTVFRG